MTLQELLSFLNEIYAFSRDRTVNKLLLTLIHRIEEEGITKKKKD